MFHKNSLTNTNAKVRPTKSKLAPSTINEIILIMAQDVLILPNI